MIIDRFKQQKDKNILTFLMLPQEMGRPYTAGLAVPSDRLAVLRSAFQKTMKDSAFLADAKRTGLDLEPIDHNAMRNVVSQLSGMPKETIARATKLLKRKNKNFIFGSIFSSIKSKIWRQLRSI